MRSRGDTSPKFVAGTNHCELKLGTEGVPTSSEAGFPEPRTDSVINVVKIGTAVLLTRDLSKKGRSVATRSFGY